jgi:hypothetical protein
VKHPVQQRHGYGQRRAVVFHERLLLQDVERASGKPPDVVAILASFRIVSASGDCVQSR